MESELRDWWGLLLPVIRISFSAICVTIGAVSPSSYGSPMLNRRTFLQCCCGGSWALAQAPPAKSSVIWDVHCHLTSAAGDTPEERRTHLIRFADRLGIDRVMLSLGYPLLEDPSDRTLGFVYLNPNQLDFSLQEFGAVEMAVRELGAQRVVYGSDAAGRSFATQLGKVMGAEIPEPARRLILGENLRRMLTPILRSKGRQV